MVRYVNVSGAAVAEVVTGDSPNDAAEIAGSGERLPELGAVDEQGISVSECHVVYCLQEKSGGVIGGSQVDGC